MINGNDFMNSTELKTLARLFTLAELDAGGCPSPELLDGSIAGTLPHVLREALDQHIESCAECRELVADVKSALHLEPLTRAFAVLRTFAASVAGIISGTKEEMRETETRVAAALAVALGMTKLQTAGVRHPRTGLVIPLPTETDPLLVCEEALRHAEISGRPEPTVTLA
jgi:hypothetical protein